MKEQFAAKDGLSLVRAMISCIREHKQSLSEIDGAIGDGDHGINMNKGFGLCAERLSGQEDLSQALDLLGSILLTEIGGSMGPLYGSMFTEMAGVCQDVESIDAQIFSAMLQAGRAAIAELGQAQVGDKTLMDTLVPAQEIFAQVLSASEHGQDGGEFASALQRMAEAAEQGKESTRNLVAQIGRASRLGERSRGVLDAGAVSCCLLLQAMGSSALALLQE